MAKGKDDIVKLPVKEPDPQTGCVVCGSYAGSFVPVAGSARAHEACASARPDVISKVKARA